MILFTNLYYSSICYFDKFVRVVNRIFSVNIFFKIKVEESG
nr:MAG TPA: hypothetical protein [Bacteriophage sp.]DAY68820.1 MAG TPA: hypothetical protein [Caudoviricetes sp.]